MDMDTGTGMTRHGQATWRVGYSMYLKNIGHGMGTPWSRLGKKLNKKGGQFVIFNNTWVSFIKLKVYTYDIFTSQHKSLLKIKS